MVNAYEDVRGLREVDSYHEKHLNHEDREYATGTYRKVIFYVTVDKKAGMSTVTQISEPLPTDFRIVGRRRIFNGVRWARFLTSY
jgi:hypothetical protein